MPRTTAQWVMTGFLAGALIPVALGIYGLYRQRVYAASLPPGEALCGMASLAAFMTMFVGGPIFGIVGGFVGWIASKVRI